MQSLAMSWVQPDPWDAAGAASYGYAHTHGMQRTAMSWMQPDPLDAGPGDVMDMGNPLDAADSDVMGTGEHMECDARAMSWARACP